MSNKEKVDKFLVEICQLILAPPVGLEPTTCGLTVRRSTDWAKGEYLCWHYLSSRAVTRQVLSAYMSLTSVFGMGTGGPSWQSTQTIVTAFTVLFFLVHPQGLEPGTHWLRVSCSTNWAKGAFQSVFHLTWTGGFCLATSTHSVSCRLVCNFLSPSAGFNLCSCFLRLTLAF